MENFMKIMYKWLFATFLSLNITSCGSDEFVLKDDTVLKTNVGLEGRRVKIEFQRGEDWFHKQKIFTFNVTITPQFSIWVENDNGEFIQNLCVTRCFAKQEWKFAKNKEDECIRTMCMPYWFNKYQKAGNKKPTLANPLPDAVTGATPTGSFILESVLGTTNGKVNVFIELNKSFDYYGEFTKERKESEFNGQPSIIYKAEIDLDSTNQDYIFKLIGHGGENGDDSKIYNDIDKVKRAQTMVKSISLEIL